MIEDQQQHGFLFSLFTSSCRLQPVILFQKGKLIRCEQAYTVMNRVQKEQSYCFAWWVAGRSFLAEGNKAEIKWRIIFTIKHITHVYSQVVKILWDVWLRRRVGGQYQDCCSTQHMLKDGNVGTTFDSTELTRLTREQDRDTETGNTYPSSQSRPMTPSDWVY